MVSCHPPILTKNQSYKSCESPPPNLYPAITTINASFIIIKIFTYLRNDEQLIFYNKKVIGDILHLFNPDNRYWMPSFTIFLLPLNLYLSV